MTSNDVDDEVMPTADEETPEDNTVDVLRSWGLSGEPVTWADLRMQPAIAIIRSCNTGFSDQAAVQGVLDQIYGEGTYAAADVCLAHPVTAEFPIAPGDIDPEVDPNVDDYLDIIHVDLVDDEDAGITDDMVSWDFGDGTPVVRDMYGWEHGYTAPGTY